MYKYCNPKIEKKKKPNLGRIPLPKKPGYAHKDKSKYDRKQYKKEDY